MPIGLERFGADRTTKRFPLFVRFQMDVVSSSLHEGFIALFATERSLARMESFMNIYGFLLRESLLTNITLVGLQVVMPLHVSAHVLIGPELFLANRAGNSSFFVVYAHNVIAQIQSRTENLTAVTAVVHALGSPSNLRIAGKIACESVKIAGRFIF